MAGIKRGRRPGRLYKNIALAVAAKQAVNGRCI
jgi:hypothetical protein